MKKGFSDPPRKFVHEEPPRHNAHIGPGPKPGAKRAVNVSVDAEILGVARAMNINLSQTLEDELRKRTRGERVRRFQAEHREAFEWYNRFIGENGIWSEESRNW